MGSRQLRPELISPIHIEQLAPLYLTLGHDVLLNKLREACVLLELADTEAAWQTCCSALNQYYIKKFDVPITRCPEWRDLNTRCHAIWIDIFRPPWKKNWTDMRSPSCQLSDTDIESIILQYTQVNQDTIFMDYTPADGYGLDSFTYRKISSSLDLLTPTFVNFLVNIGITKVVWLVSTNPSISLPDAGHWVTIVAGIDPHNKSVFGVNFFDSIGIKDLGYCENLLKMVTFQMSAVFKDRSVPVRRIVTHYALQRDRAPYSCGLFVTHFGVSMMDQSKNFYTIVKDPVMDDDALDKSMRPFYFPQPFTHR